MVAVQGLVEDVQHLQIVEVGEVGEPEGEVFGDDVVEVGIAGAAEQTFADFEVIDWDDVLVADFALSEDIDLLLLVGVDQLDPISFCKEIGSSGGLNKMGTTWQIDELVV